MRLHELTVTAFGPFVETVRVDFDDLGAGGLFLLTGDTGAGKSSILDAVCFGLYGEVPGDRHTAKHLRSDHAMPEAEPRVVLRFSVAGRTFRLSRSPAWDRPRQRGEGTRRVQAHVVAEELRGAEWIALSNRLDEVGHLVTGLLGMTCSQFTQVAMLPQGRFQAFLRASSSERHAVLQRLFRTRRFEDVERWLVDRRVDLARRSRADHDRCSGVLARLQEAGGVVPADADGTTWDLHDLEPRVADDSLRAWVTALGDDTRAAVGLGAAELDRATREVARTRDLLDAARSTVECRGRGLRARGALTCLDDTAAEARALLESREAHDRAAPVLPLVRQASRAATEDAAARRALEQHATGLDEVLTGHPHPDLALLDSVAAQTREARAEARSWLPREHELERLRPVLRGLGEEVVRSATRLQAAQQTLVELAAQRAAREGELAEAADLAARVAADQALVEAAAQGLAAAERADDVRGRLAESRTRLELAVQQAQDLREQWLDLREQRISGMAAELALGLAAGCSCPVCGSAEHPSPAHVTGHVSRADEDDARTRHEAADFERQAVQEVVSGHRSGLDAAEALSGGRSAAQWTDDHDAAATALAVSTAAARQVTRLRSDLAATVERETQLAVRTAADEVTLQERRREQAQARARCEELEDDLAGLLAPHPQVSSVAELLRGHDDLVERLEQTRHAWERVDRAASELHRAARAASEAARDAGFVATDGAVAAVLPQDRVARVDAELDRRRATRAAAEAVLDEDDVVRALAEPEPDLASLRHAAEAASVARDGLHAAHEHATTRAGRVATLTTELDRVLDAWEPVRREHEVVGGLASLVEGKGADNLLRMRLSAYVLGERLRQVVAAANERLVAMTDERYALEQVDEKGAGEQRGGLSLRVRDEWSGRRRDPATLSGGETFLVSLALALGLADTVSHEAGGTQLDTLFIDEGFGALDATTLDAVMDTLDSLRDGGRVVGLVSHVPELRTRVTSQLEVLKARSGSTVRSTVGPTN